MMGETKTFPDHEDYRGNFALASLLLKTVKMKFFKQKESDTRHIGASGRKRNNRKSRNLALSQEISKSYLVIEPKVISGKRLIPVDFYVTYEYCDIQNN